MVFAELIKRVFHETFDVFRPLKVDFEDGSLHKDVREVVVDKGFIILKLRKEKSNVRNSN